MPGSRLALLSALLFLVVALGAPASAQQETAAAGSLLVKLVPGLSAIQQADVITRNGGFTRSVVPALRLYVVDVLAADLAATLARYAADPQVERVEENRLRVSEAIPNDPLFSNQWFLPRIAWDQAFGTFAPPGTATVAVLDTGVDQHHPELAGKVVPGISFLDGGDGRTDPSGHGTALAGIIAALTDTIPPDGIAGIGWAGVQVMPVTVLNADGEGQDGDIIAGVVWAADHGADVILMAFSNPGFSPSLQEAIDYAWSRGAVLVASTGNHGTSDPRFPAGHRGVMGVAATDQTDAMVPWSSHGQAAFIAAPGVDIQTIDIGDAYAVFSGTSTSAAIVAGAAALVKATDPTLPNGVIVYRLASTADPAGAQTQTGNGRVNLARALLSTETRAIQPAGADPVGEGGPFVGPYTADTVTAVTLISPTTASPAVVTSLPATIAVAFTYSSSGPAGTVAQARVVSGATTLGTSGPFQSVPTGTNQSHTLFVALPAGTANGSYRVEVEVQNMTSPPGPTSRSDARNMAVTVNVPADAIAPVVTVTFPPPSGANGWFVTRPVVGSVTATDPSNVTAISCSGAALGTITGQGTPSATASLTVDAEGAHSVSCSATDGAGNSGAASGSSNTATVKVDTQAPDTTLTGVPPSPTNVSTATFNFTGNDPAPSSGGLGFECALDAAPFASCTSPRTYMGLADGAHTFQVRARDGAGNADPTPASFTWTVDTTPPTVTVTFPAPNGSNGWFKTSPVVGTVTATDALSNVTAISCPGFVVGSLTGAGTPSATAGVTVSGEGIHSVSCTATDSLGNAGAGPGSMSTATVKIDTVAPTVALNPVADSCSLPGNGGWCRGTQTAGFAASDATSGLAGPASFTRSTATNGGAVVIASGPVCDLAGNCNPGIDAGPYRIDSVAPTITIGAPADGAVLLLNQMAASSYQCSDATSGVASCAGPVPDGGQIDTSTVGPKAFAVNAEDAAGNTAALTHAYHVQYASGGLCHGAPGHAILQPVNADGTSVFRQKSTVPAKFRVCDANGVSVGTPGVVAAFQIIQVVQGTVTTDVTENVDSTTPHSAFRWDANEQQWIFNIDTKPLSAGRTYAFRIWLNDLTTIDFRFGLR